ncbi:MAG: tryptophan--tRNA ligase [Spirochaetales bacterium]|nr:tryptophan--tRNA ligase [Spirochaetales bacterium]
MKTLFTGIQPTGSLHLGNYFGAVKNWVKLQHNFETYISIVDLHAITILYNPKDMQKRILDLALNLYACGIDKEKTTLFVQSEVPGHADLTWMFNTVIPIGELERMTQFKDKAKQNKKNVNMGLLDYPVLQAADILLYKAGIVPVGDDQIQHIELTREIARRFNSRYGKTFPECEAYLTETPRVMGIDGENKMSKSKNNAIGLLESRDDIWSKLAGAKTDPARIRRSDAGDPEKCNIFSYHKLVTPEEEREEIIHGCKTAGIGCVDCKKRLLKSLFNVLGPIQERYSKLILEKKEIIEILESNAEKCRKVAKNTIIEAKEKMGLKPVWKI